jgi:hypothetical protein
MILKTDEYLMRHSYPLPKPNHGFGIAEHYFDLIKKNPDRILTIRDNIFERRDSGIWLDKPRQTLEWSLATIPSMPLVQIALSQHLTATSDRYRLCVDAAKHIDEWILELANSAQIFLDAPRNRKINAVFGLCTPLFLIGSILGRTRIFEPIRCDNQNDLVAFIAHCATFCDMPSMNKVWPHLDREHYDKAMQAAWSNLPNSLNCSLFPTPDPPRNWWSNAIIRNPINGPGRSHMMSLVASRPHLAVFLNEAQLGRERQEIEDYVLQPSSSASMLAIDRILIGWVKKIAGGVPTSGNLRDLHQRLIAVPGTAKSPFTPSAQAWARLITCIQSIKPSDATSVLPNLYASDHSPDFPTAASAISQIWPSYAQQGSDPESLSVLDLGRLAIMGEAELEISPGDPVDCHGKHISKMNELLRVIFREWQISTGETCFSERLIRQAQRVLRPKWPTKFPKVSDLDQDMKGAHMENLLWKLAIVRLSGAKPGLPPTAPLGNKEKGLVRNIRLMDRSGGRLQLPSHLAKAFEVSLREDDNIPDWLTSLLQQGALMGGSGNGSIGRRRL